MTCKWLPEPKGLPYMSQKNDQTQLYVAKCYCPVQGPFIDCHLIAALSSIAWINDTFIKNQGSLTVYSSTFYDPQPDATQYPAGTTITTPMPVTVSVNANICMDSVTGVWCCSRGCDETWVALFEKAFAKFCMFKIKKTMSWANLGNASVNPVFSSLPDGSDWGGNPAMVLQYLADGSVKKYTYTVVTTDAYAIIKALCPYNALIGKLNIPNIGIMNGDKVKVPMGAWTYKNETEAQAATGVSITYNNATIVGNHCYSILGIYEDSNGKYIVMRNPYGKADPAISKLGKGPWFMYNKLYSIGTSCKPKDTSITGKSIDFSAVDGIFALDVNIFKQYFEGFGYIF